MVLKKYKNLLDSTDKFILSVLLSDGRHSYKEIGRTVRKSTSSITARARRLKENGIIKGFHTDINLAVLGFPLNAFLEIKVAAGPALNTVKEELKKIPGVFDIFVTTGSPPLLVRTVSSGYPDFLDLLTKIRSLEGIVNVNSSIVVESTMERNPNLIAQILDLPSSEK